MRRAYSAEILLVEDNEYDAELTLMSLTEVNLANCTLWLQNGKQALNYLTAKEEYAGRNMHHTPRLIILDLKMPQINGIEFLHKIRAYEHTKHIAVIVFTSSSHERDILETYELGVDHYIEKPMDLENFSASIKEIVGVGYLRNKIRELPTKILRRHRKKTERLINAGVAKDFDAANQRFRSLVQHASGLIFIIDYQGKFSFVSENCAAVLGYEPEELHEQNYLQLIHPEEMRSIAGKLEQLEEINSFATGFYRLVDAKGRWRWFHSIVTDMRNDSSVNGIVINARDVTDQVQKERALQWSNERYKIVSRVTQDLIYDWNLQTQEITRDGDAMQRLFGFEPKYANQGVFWRKQIHPEDVNRVYKSIEEKLREKESNFFSLEYRFRGADGAYVYVSDSGAILRNNKDQAVRIIGATRDITEQKNKEVQKEVLLEISKYMNQHASLKICLTNVLKKLVMFSDAVVGEVWITSRNDEYMNRIASYTRGEKGAYFIKSAEITRDHQKEGLVGRIWEHEEDLYWHHAGDCADFLRFNVAQQAGLKAGYGFPVVHHDQVIGLFFFFFEQDTNRAHLQRIFSNFGKVLAPELQRKRSKDELDNFFRLSPDLMCISSTNGTLLKVNPAFTHILGYAEKELLNHSCFEYIHPDDFAATRYSLKAIGEKAGYLENRLITKAGKVKWLAWSYTRIEEEDIIIAVGKDVTEQKNFQQQLLENTIQAQEQERNRIAQDLHDSIVQELIGCGMKSENLVRYIEDENKLEKELFQLSELMRKIAVNTRKISHNLLSAEMHEMSLEQLMEQLGRQLEYFTEIDFQLSTYLSPDIKIRDEVKVNLYRCIQELINNIIKHSGASEAFVVLEDVAGMVYVSVRDNGIGMTGNAPDKGIGISNVKSRVNALGGKISFRNPEKGGLEVSIEVPVNAEKISLLGKTSSN